MSQGTVVELSDWFPPGLIYWAVPILDLTFPGNFNVLPGLENREHKAPSIPGHFCSFTHTRHWLNAKGETNPNKENQHCPSALTTAESSSSSRLLSERLTRLQVKSSSWQELLLTVKGAFLEE